MQGQGGQPARRHENENRRLSNHQPDGRGAPGRGA